MAINKKNSPLWVKVVIIIVAVSFVASIALVGFGSLGGGGGGSTNSGSTDGTLASQYQPQVDSALSASKADPTNAALLANVGHVYYEWAVEEYESGAIDASRPHWLSAVAYYDESLAIQPDNTVLLGNKAFALTYAGSPGAKEALETFIATDDPTLTDQIGNAKQLLAEIVANESTTTTTTP